MTQVLVAYAPAISLCLGVLAGAAAARIGRPKRTAFDPITEPIRLAMCNCRHPLSSHDPDTNRCHETDRREGFYTPGEWSTRDIPCPCRQYVGPRPIDQVFSPRILPPD